MIKKLALYFNTIKYMKISQLYFRALKKIGIKIRLGCKPSFNRIVPLKFAEELDYAPEMLKRFDVEELLSDKVTLLHSTREFDWDGTWYIEDETPLWNFNLHYCEYLYALVEAEQIDKVLQIIHSWIEQNPKEKKGAGWDPYTISLRLIVWIAIYPYINADKTIENSIFEQYSFLSDHLEKDILGNHLFEELKTLVICAKFFNDDNVYRKALSELKKQCREQILPDGMHFELSPMYHNLILEDVLRVALVTGELKEYIKPMLDVAFSLEEGLERLPLFNDCGNNVAKGLITLQLVAKKYFDIEPEMKMEFPEAGYYIFKDKNWKMIVDAGQPGPKYLPAHSHCDIGSFEYFIDGKPILVNCGTYAYQDDSRLDYKRTAAHNTVMIDETEQSELWGAFRMARRAKCFVIEKESNWISMIIENYHHKKINRTIEIGTDRIKVCDRCDGEVLKAFYHECIYDEDCNCRYSYDFGLIEHVKNKVIVENNFISFTYKK